MSAVHDQPSVPEEKKSHKNAKPTPDGAVVRSSEVAASRSAERIAEAVEKVLNKK